MYSTLLRPTQQLASCSRSTVLFHFGDITVVEKEAKEWSGLHRPHSSVATRVQYSNAECAVKMAYHNKRGETGSG